MRRDQRRGEVLNFIEDFTIENRCPPTVREIQNALNIKSTSTVYDDIIVLKEEGFLEKVGSRIAPVYTEEYLEKLRKLVMAKR